MLPGFAPRLSFLLGPAFEVGVDGEAQRFSTDLAFATPDGMRPTPPALLADLARTRNALSLRAYAAAIIPLGRLKVEPGLRYAQYFEQGVTRGAFEPRLTARFLIARALSVDATVGALARAGVGRGIGQGDQQRQRDHGRVPTHRPS